MKIARMKGTIFILNNNEREGKSFFFLPYFVLILTENRYQKHSNILRLFCILFHPGNWSGSFWLNDFDGWQEKGFFQLLEKSLSLYIFFEVLTFVKNTFRLPLPSWSSLIGPTYRNANDDVLCSKLFVVLMSCSILNPQKINTYRNIFTLMKTSIHKQKQHVCSNQEKSYYLWINLNQLSCSFDGNSCAQMIKCQNFKLSRISYKKLWNKSICLVARSWRRVKHQHITIFLLKHAKKSKHIICRHFKNLLWCETLFCCRFFCVVNFHISFPIHDRWTDSSSIFSNIEDEERGRR